VGVRARRKSITKTGCQLRSWRLWFW